MQVVRTESASTQDNNILADCNNKTNLRTQELTFSGATVTVRNRDYLKSNMVNPTSYFPEDSGVAQLG
jgi:hypothetical protein